MASMMELIRRNRRNTWVLIFVFMAILVTLGVLIGSAVGGPDWVSALVGAIIAATIAFFMVLFGFLQGDSLILSMSQAREIAHQDLPQLFNVVEELSIAAGVPMPRVYLIDDPSPNAFATGRDPAHASVAITRGLIEKLTRDELQGVMAHEMSHVRNHDIRFAMLMAILVGTVVLISDAFLRMLFYGGRSRGRSSSRDRGGALMLIMLLIAILFAIIAPLLAKIIQLAVSRQREFLADASAVEMTRLPDGLACALEKIQADGEPLEAANRATAHLYIVNPVMKLKGREGSSMWDSHPPIEERIRRLREIT
jgi:heat shock protein HtpX